jgi:uncharacterized lipoprotein YbaY
VTKIPATIAVAVALSGCSALAQSNTAPIGANVGVTGTASDALSNTSGSTSSSMEEQRIKQQHGNSAPTSYVNGTHFPS